MCRRPCTAIPTRTGARCDCASRGDPGTAGTDTPEGDAPTEATDAEAPAHPEAPDATDAEATEAGTSAAETGEVAEASADEATGSAEATEGAGDTAGASADGEEDAAAPALSEAQAELAAQRELRERIAQRKAAKDGPVAAGTKLSGTAADLLAAVRAVESGQKTGTEFFDSHLGTPTPRRAAPAPAVRPRRPDPAAAPVERPAASPEAVDAVRAVLTEGGAPEALARPATGALGEQAAELLRADPWQLLAAPGVRPEQADGFARALLGVGCGPDDERRTAALVGWVLERAALQGHTALDAETVRAALAERAVRDPDGAVRHAVEEGWPWSSRRARRPGSKERRTWKPRPRRKGAPPGAGRPRRRSRSRCCWDWTATRWPRRASPTAWPAC